MANISVPLRYYIFQRGVSAYCEDNEESFRVLKRVKEPRIRYAPKACAHHLPFIRRTPSLSRPLRTDHAMALPAVCGSGCAGRTRTSARGKTAEP